MRVKSITAYKDKNGKRRYIRLYGAWKNMNGRITGVKHSHGKYYWEGITTDFYTWAEFRGWSLANGYSKRNNSLDRINPELGYTRDNCRWIPFDQHRAFTQYRSKKQ